MKLAKCILLMICFAYASMIMAVDYKLYQTSSSRLKQISLVEYYAIDEAENVYRKSTNTMNHLPEIDFHSTSVLSGTGYVLPVAAISGITTTNDFFYGISGPNRIDENNYNNGDGPPNPDDPWKTPVGDIPWLLIALLVVVTVPRLRGRLAKNNVTGETE